MPARQSDVYHPVMPTIGMIGGIAPPSTIDYYRLLVDGYQARRADGSQPLLLINSIDLQTGLRLVADAARGHLEPFVAFMAAEVDKLARAGATFGFFAANTPHLAFDEIQARVHIPLVSIAEATAAEARRLALRTVGLLGTRFTMEADFYGRALGRHGIRVVVPAEPDRTWVHDHYLSELTKNIFRAETRTEMRAVIERLRASHALDGVILGGTELPLLLREAPPLPIPLLDTTQIHVAALLDRYFEA